MNPIIPSVALTLLLGSQHADMPTGMSHEEHLKQVQKDEALKKRGTETMGFDQDNTTHHFRLSSTGGSIEVTVKDDADRMTISAIRSHLRSIADDFAAGRFDKPFQTHGEVPPGVVEMQQRKEEIVYRYVDRPRGGAVQIDTGDGRTLEAIHAFLRYQITEHHTGDTLEYKR